MSQLETNFVHTARQQVKYGPSSVSDFTRWKVRMELAKGFWVEMKHLPSLFAPQVEMLAKEHLRSVKDREDEEVEMVSAEEKRRHASVILV